MYFIRYFFPKNFFKKCHVIRIPFFKVSQEAQLQSLKSFLELVEEYYFKQDFWLHYAE